MTVHMLSGAKCARELIGPDTPGSGSCRCLLLPGPPAPAAGCCWWQQSGACCHGTTGSAGVPGPVVQWTRECRARSEATWFVISGMNGYWRGLLARWAWRKQSVHRLPFEWPHTQQLGARQVVTQLGYIMTMLFVVVGAPNGNDASASSARLHAGLCHAAH